MPKFTITINVDAEALRKARESSISEEEAKNESIIDAIEQEMGWVNQSGISVESIKIAKSQGKYFLKTNLIKSKKYESIRSKS